MRKINAAIILMIIMVMVSSNTFAQTSAHTHLSDLKPIELIINTFDLVETSKLNADRLVFQKDDVKLSFDMNLGKNYVDDKEIQGYAKPLILNGVNYVAYELVIDALGNNLPLSYYGTQGTETKEFDVQSLIQGEWRIVNTINETQFVKGFENGLEYQKSESNMDYENKLINYRVTKDRNESGGEWKQAPMNEYSALKITKDQFIDVLPRNKATVVNVSDYKLVNNKTIVAKLNEKASTGTYDSVQLLESKSTVDFVNENTYKYSYILEKDDFVETEYEAIFESIKVDIVYERIEKLPVDNIEKLASIDHNGNKRLDYLETENGENLVPVHVIANATGAKVNSLPLLGYTKLSKNGQEIIFDTTEGALVHNSKRVNGYQSAQYKNGVFYVSPNLVLDIFGDKQVDTSKDQTLNNADINIQLLGEWRMTDRKVFVKSAEIYSPTVYNTRIMEEVIDYENKVTKYRVKDIYDEDLSDWIINESFDGTIEKYGMNKAIKDKSILEGYNKLVYDFKSETQNMITISLNKSESIADFASWTGFYGFDKSTVNKQVEFEGTNKFTTTSQYHELDLEAYGFDGNFEKFEIVEIFERVQ